MNQRPIARLLVLIAILGLALGPTAGGARQDPLQASTRSVNVELILDASGSMAEPLPGGETRMEAAKRILREVIEGLPEREGVSVGLRVYGHLGDNSEAGKAVSCGASELLVPIAGLDKAALLAQVEAIQPTGWTPIAYSLKQAAADFQPGGESITNTIVLVTDGEETCDPPQQSCQAAASLRAADVSVTTHVVGFALTSEQTELVRCVAEEGGGQLFGADNPQELGQALTGALGAAGVAVTPAPQVVPAPPPLATIRTLGYHQLTAWSAEQLPGYIPDYPEQTPILSDDGQRIAFGVHPGEGAADPRNRIYVLNADGSGQREVDAYPFLCFCGSMIDLSADGSRVVSSDAVQLRVADSNGGGGRELLALDSNEITAVRISADGSTIVFRIYRDTGIRDTAPSERIERGIYRINPDGSGLQQLVGPDELGALLGVAADQAPFFGGTSGLDVSANGAQIVFTSTTSDIDPATGSTREGLFVVNGDGSGLRRLLGPTFTYANANAISGDGATVAYVTTDYGANLQQAGVLGFDGSGQRTLTDSTTSHPGTGANLPSGERIQLSFDGSRLLLGSTGLLYDTVGGGVLALGVAAPGFSGDPTPLVVDGLYHPTMSADASRAVYMFQPVGEPYQIARVDLNPPDLGPAPTITDAGIAPPYVLLEGRSAATVSARVSTVNPFLRVSSRVLRDGLPDPNVYTAVLYDDGATGGDPAANDGLFTSNGVGADCCAAIGPRVVRIKAETQAGDGLRHATAVDVEPFAVTTEVPPDLPPTATVVPPTVVPSTPDAGECRWTGVWDTAYGEMRLVQSDGTVTGDYDNDEGQISGTVTGNVLSGSWTEAPSRQPPSDAGSIEFTMADDCQSFTGKWSYGPDGELGGDWPGTRQPVTPVPSTPTAVPATSTPASPTITPLPPTSTPIPTATAVPPTATSIPPTGTPSPTAIPMPTLTPVLPTATAMTSPTAPPTATITTPVPSPTPGPTVSPTAVPMTTPAPGGCNCEELAAARATVAAQATRIAELEGRLGIPTATPTAPTSTASPSAAMTATPSVGPGPADPLAGDFVTPDPAECTVAPRALSALQAITATPDRAASDALRAAVAVPGLEAPAGQPADAATADAVRATYRQMAACFNAGNVLAAYALWTDDALRQIGAQPPATDVAQALPADRWTAVRVTEVRILPDGRVAAIWEERNALFTNAFVQVLAPQGDRYLIDEILDLTIA